ncbi:hypothetical protein JG687_00016832 [Phytophthora cactorum]|uniref:Uncharacterized protein n=1 Tax=Phytophthora cactorum TaxID=29920 RepID=A0A8T1TQY9_9STRA|nr:hypothetical protein JG687_00016832 [Phytophthora cactorum]
MISSIRATASPPGISRSSFYISNVLVKAETPCDSNRMYCEANRVANAICDMGPGMICLNITMFKNSDNWSNSQKLHSNGVPRAQLHINLQQTILMGSQNFAKAVVAAKRSEPDLDTPLLQIGDSDDFEIASLHRSRGRPKHNPQAR